MQNNVVTNVFSVSPQIEVSDISKIKELGFKSIICNSPDNEVDKQIGYDSIRIEAEKILYTYPLLVRFQIINIAEMKL